MDLLIVIGLLLAFVFGMCAGSAINREYAAAFARRATRASDRADLAERQLLQLRADITEARWCEHVPTPTPAVVHVHLETGSVPTWGPLPVLNGVVLPELHAGGQR